MKLTIVICTHNRINLLIDCINSIYEALRPKNQDISILIIANACTDNTIQTLRHFQPKHDQLKLSVFEEPRIGKSFALNHGLSLIESGYICFIDDDQIIDTNYFVETIQAIDYYPDASIICGKLLPNWKGDEPQWVHNKDEYPLYPLPIPIYDLGPSPCKIGIEDELPPGGHVIINRAIFDKLGGFSINLGPIGHNLVGSEDTDFFKRALEYGEIIQYVPSILQFHYIDKTRLQIKYLLIKCYQRNRSITLTRYPQRHLPHLYLFRLLFNYLIKSIFCFNINGKRFFLMRFFSVLGEIAGMLESIPEQKCRHTP